MAGRSRRLRTALPLILLVMILMRLVWMQLRSYPVMPELRALVSLAELGASDTCDYDPSLPRPDAVFPGATRAQQARIVSPGYVALGYAGCLAGWRDDREFVRLNQWLLATTVLLCMFLARFTTSSWTVSLMVGAMLMSRGRLLADISRVSVDFPAMLTVTAWITAQAHFVRTGAVVSLVAAMGIALVAPLVDSSLLALSLTTPLLLGLGFMGRRRLARPVIRRLRGAQEAQKKMERLAPAVYGAQGVEVGSTSFGRVAAVARRALGMEFTPEDPTRDPARALVLPPMSRASPVAAGRGGLFRTLAVPFLLWIYARRRWARLSLGWLGIAAVAALLGAGVDALLAGGSIVAAIGSLATAAHQALPVLPELFPRWHMLFAMRFDLHLTASLLIVFAAAAQSPAAGLAGFLETAWLTLVGALLVVGVAIMADAVDTATIAAAGGVGGFGLAFPFGLRDVALWWEPTILSLGAAGIYNLMKVLDTRIAKTT